MTTPILDVQGLVVRRGPIQVLEIPSFALEQSSVTALIGPNGSGKSTFLQTLASLIEPATGVVSFHGQPLRTRRERHRYRQQVTLVFQESLLFDATVRSNLAVGLKLHGIPRAEREQRIQESAARFGITAIPTLIVFKDGEPVKRFVGVTSKDDLAAGLNAAMK